MDPEHVTCPVVGIGASAGGLAALRELLRFLPADAGMAYVVVQHLDPTHESLLPTLLARATRMGVHEAREEMGERAADLLAKMDVQLDKLIHLISELLDVTRLEGKK